MRVSEAAAGIHLKTPARTGSDTLELEIAVKGVGKMKYSYAKLDSLCGPLLCFVSASRALTHIEFLPESGESIVARKLRESGYKLRHSQLKTRGPRRQLDEYFKGKRREFDLDIEPQGTEFQTLVWNALLQIPYGQTRSYGEIAGAISRPRSARAVGAATGANPIPIVIPCHRVLGADGSLTGFRGGLVIKKFLLMLEGRHRPHPSTGQLEFDF